MNEFDGKTDDELLEIIEGIEAEIEKMESDDENYETIEDGWDIEEWRPRYSQKLTLGNEYFISELGDRINTIKNELSRRAKHE